MDALAEVGAAILPSLVTSTALPMPGGMLNTPGAIRTTGTGFGAEETPFTVTTTDTVPDCWPGPNAPNGSCALSCAGSPGITFRSGAGTSPKVTDTPPSDVENGTVSAEAKLVARFAPKIDTSDPTATGIPRPFASFAKLAPFKTPPSATAGVCA